MKPKLTKEEIKKLKKLKKQMLENGTHINK